MNVSAKFAVRIALAVPEIIAIAVLGWGCGPPILEKRGRRRSGMVPFEIALGVLIVTITRFENIAAFVLQHAPFPTPPLVSPTFLRVSL